MTLDASQRAAAERDRQKRLNDTRAATRSYVQKHAEATGKGMVRAIVEHLREHLSPVNRRVADLERRIAELEQTRAFAYRGTWQKSDVYQRGNYATHDGSLWHSNTDCNAERPGTGDAWTLVAKGR